MSYQIPTVEPLVIEKGDRVKWKKTLTDYPATSEGWTLTYYLRRNSAVAAVTIAATADGDSFLVDLSTTTTAAYTSAQYWWESYVSKSGERYKVGEGRIEVQDNWASVSTAFDGRSHARVALEAIEAVIENRATRDEMSYTIQAAGRSVSKLSHKELIDFRKFYQGEVAREEQAEAIARGRNPGNRVLVRFK